MISRRSVFAVALLAPTLGYADSDFTVDPDSIPITTRANWCNSQIDTCNSACSEATSTNTCDISTLVYACVCSDGTTPDMQYYGASLPNLICLEALAECIDAEESGDDDCSVIAGECQAPDATGKPLTATSSTSSVTATSYADTSISSILIDSRIAATTSASPSSTSSTKSTSSSHGTQSSSATTGTTSPTVTKATTTTASLISSTTSSSPSTTSTSGASRNAAYIGFGIGTTIAALFATLVC
ncbi:hypothetical protein BX600DRAFT_513932 [Xylariales sp. PMI_506]|nr:hypothetical protein BX600DRAFT_513932 [Xylariales sp. PMI_506]